MIKQKLEAETNILEMSNISLEKDKKQKIQISYDIHENDQNQKTNQILERCLQIFPYPDPYPSQKDSMKNIIESLCKNKNLLFQSPTGTGKTLVTLCAALAFIEDQKDTQILLLTRTNEQINGFIKEIRKITGYADIDQYAILTGRGKFCMKLKEADQYFGNQIYQKKINKFLTKFCQENTQLCNNQNNSIPNYKILLPAKNKQVEITDKSSDIKDGINPCENCKHYQIHKQMMQDMVQKQIQKLSYPKISKSNKQQPYALPDIEEIRDLFEQENLGCPFYYNRIAAKYAKIIFTSYNYVIKQQILQSISDVFSGKLIVIFDEAHNISEQAEQEQKIKLRPKHLEQLIETTNIMQKNFSKQRVTNNKFDINKEVRELITIDINKELEFLKDESFKKMIVEKGQGYSEEDYNQIDKKKYTHANYQKQNKFDNQKQQNKFFQEANNLDLYNKVYQTIQYSGNIFCGNSKFIKNFQEFIKKSITYKYFDEIETEQIFDQFKQERQTEVYNKLDNLLNDCINIDIECEGLIQQFKINQNTTSKPFCVLFSEKEKIEKHFRRLQIDDTEQIKEFLERIPKLYNLFLYIKKIIKIQIQELKNSEDNNKKNHPPDDVVVKEGDNIYNAVPEFDIQKKLEKILKQLQIKYFKKIWLFYKKLQKFWILYQNDSKQTILQDHYLSLMRNQANAFELFFQFGSLSASYLFKKISKKLNIQSMIFTSGTLEPFELIEQSIRIPFQKYSASHIIDPQTNLFTQFISSYNGQIINFSKSQMDDEIKKQRVQIQSNAAIELIKSIFVDFTKKVCKKAGIIIFFKNYQMMNDYYIQSNEQCKDYKIFIETKDAKKFKKMYDTYKSYIENNEYNCLFLAVNRGKLSEGIDLKDELCRIIILLGVPYSNISDPYVKCKKLYSQQYLKEGRWYEKETVKVVNQAAGRCIRYKDDWGCIFFIDDQYIKDIIYRNISKWIQEGQKQLSSQNNKWINLYEQFLESQFIKNQINTY